MALLVVLCSRMVGGGMEEDGCVWRGVEFSWDEKEMEKKCIQIN